MRSYDYILDHMEVERMSYEMQTGNARLGIRIVNGVLTVHLHADAACLAATAHVHDAFGIDRNYDPTTDSAYLGRWSGQTRINNVTLSDETRVTRREIVDRIRGSWPTISINRHLHAVQIVWLRMMPTATGYEPITISAILTRYQFPQHEYVAIINGAPFIPFVQRP